MVLWLGLRKLVSVLTIFLALFQVGKRLRSLTKHPRKKIQSVATGLIEMWKEIVIAETSKDGKNGKLENTASPRLESPRPEKMQRTSSMKSERGSKAEPVKVERASSMKVERGSKADEPVKVDRAPDRNPFAKTERPSPAENVKVEKPTTKEVKKPAQGSSVTPKLTSMVRSNDSARDKVREMLHEALAKVASESGEEFADRVKACDPIRVAVTVESVLFENWGGSTGAQKAKYRSLIFNLKDSKNPDFRRRVLLGQVEAEMLVDMNTSEMASDERRQEVKKIEEKALFECERGGPRDGEATTDQFKCGRCGKRKTTYYQMQTRSADEPMTTYVTCVNCNNRWKFC